MKHIQESISRHIFDRDVYEEFSFIKPYATSEELKERLDVHRQTILENLVNALKITYPCIWKLVGESCARGIALSYIHDLGNLPKDGRAHDFGNNFPEYLKEFPSIKHIPYLSDVAKLEWLKSLSYHARISHKISFENIQNLNEDQLYKTCFEFNDSFHLLCSCHPLLEIQEIVDNNQENAKLSINEESFHYYVIYQKDYIVSTAEIEESHFLFLTLLREGKYFGDAADKCLFLFPDFDLSICIGFMINSGFIAASFQAPD